jgi:hypothetical protein
MTILKRAVLLAVAAMLVPALWGTAAQAQSQHSLVAGSGGQAQIGGGLPLPIQVFTLGTTPGQAAIVPPLLIPANPTPIVNQTALGAITVPASILALTPTAIQKQPTFASNPSVFQVNTALDYAWPSATATFAPGGGPAGGAGIFIGGGPPTGVITYTNAGAAFGGSALFAVAGNAGLAAGGAIIGQPVTVYINYMGQVASMATGAALVGAIPNGAQYGATTAAATVTTPGVQADPGFMGGAFGAGGTVLASVQCGPTCPGLLNNVLGDKGFPWTTGMITVSQPAAVPAEIFYLSGTDTRPGGVGSGNISMVSGTLSNRSLSGPNANRAWVSLQLPEPTALAGAAGALLMLGACHSMVRRRRS